MNTAKKWLALILSLTLMLSLSACGSSQNEAEEETGQETYTTLIFELEDGPEVTIDADPDSGYTMLPLSEDEEDEDEDEDGFDFTISSEDETIYGSFKTVTALTKIELYYYDGYEEVEIGGLEGFLVQADEDEYDLFLELDDDENYICLTSYEEDADLTGCAQALTITVTAAQEEE